MKTISIIAKYNPFHNGHAWQIAEAKRRTSADFALIVMSGDFVLPFLINFPAPGWLCLAEQTSYSSFRSAMQPAVPNILRGVPAHFLPP